MKGNWKRLLLVAWLSCLCASWHAGVLAKPLLLQIAGGKYQGIPLALSNFAKDADVLEAAGMDPAQVVRQDLQNSGQFRIIFSEQRGEISVAQKRQWQSLGAEYLVCGELQAEAESGYFTVVFHIMDLYADVKQTLLSMRFRHKHKQELRALAHHISDQVFEKITGLRGFFSTKIAYIGMEFHDKEHVQHLLTVADADGYNPEVLFESTAPLMSPAWSHDGKHLAFVSFAGHRASVNILEVRSAKIRKISAFPGINGTPAWSPDGRTLALVLSKDGFPNLYLIDIHSKNLTRITHGSFIDTEPCWSADGQSIVFTSNRSGKPQIYRVLLASQKVERLTFTGDYNTSPALTPDGKQLVMLHRAESGFHIAVQHLQTGKLKILTKAKLDESPSIAPNGTMILYGSIEGSKSILGAVSLDGKFNMRLQVRGNVKEPVWSPYLQG
jgi:TolB protein